MEAGPLGDSVEPAHGYVSRRKKTDAICPATVRLSDRLCFLTANDGVSYDERHHEIQSIVWIRADLDETARIDARPSTLP